MGEVLGGFSIIFFLFLLVLAILWFLLPFAVFSIKARAEESVKIQRGILKELRAINESGQSGMRSAPKSADNAPAERKDPTFSK